MEKKRTYGVWAVRSSTSIFGPAQSWCKENGKPLEFDSKADAENYPFGMNLMRMMTIQSILILVIFVRKLNQLQMKIIYKLFGGLDIK